MPHYSTVMQTWTKKNTCSKNILSVSNFQGIKDLNLRYEGRESRVLSIQQEETEVSLRLGVK